MAYEIVVMGSSLGGFSALKVVLSGLPASFPTPLALVQHQASSGSAELPRLLQRYCALPVSAPDDKTPVQPGQVYVAPPGYHLLVDRQRFALSADAPVRYARPSIDILFESAADAFGAGTFGVALTASSPDGAAGIARIKERGGTAIVQDPALAESRVLIDAVLASTSVDRVLPLRKIAPFLVLACQGQVRS